ncbi:hypothetical protein BC828DRAFT_55801 [Blastocladiella britannica]|nr:hypothetical protein BC828DRAFT_55801 [Blastocladiella britannica]
MTSTPPRAELNVHVINRILVHAVLEDTTEDCPGPEHNRMSKGSLATAHRSRLALYARVMLRDDAPDVVMAIFRCAWSMSPDMASELGWIETLQVRRSLGLPFTYLYSRNAMDGASCNGHINVLNWWHDSGFEPKYSDWAMEWASCNGHIDVLNWWCDSSLELKYSNWAMDWASDKGHINMLQWWRASGLKLKYSEIAMDWASRSGHVDVLNWWRDSGLELKYSLDAMSDASKNGHIDVLKWWRASGLELKYSENAMDWASKNGHVDVLEWWRNFVTIQTSRT